ncbi:PIN domain-containing protein [Coleofasciculus sp. E2-BRE-01]|uniref:PIN domain-containing protein n=1 Tax=Coleofasciculus sp. E2-BRE-01 TaxID=3069524 RepID=UPI003300A7C2
MSICTGRDLLATTLLQNTPSSVQLVMPSICLMESLSALEKEQKYRRRFENELNLQISQLRRDVTSSHARSMLALLMESRTENEQLLAEIKMRLYQAINQISGKAELIALTPSMIQDSLTISLIDQDYTDNLILHCILHQARLYPTETQAFLSSNERDFGTPEVQAALGNVGITNYFSSTQVLLNWLQSQQSE